MQCFYKQLTDFNNILNTHPLPFILPNSIAKIIKTKLALVSLL